MMRKNNGLLTALLVTATLFLSVRSSATPITLSGSVAVYVDDTEKAPVHKAVADLLRDLTTVLGKAPALVKAIPENQPVIVVTTGGVYASGKPAATGWEAHQIYVNGHHVVLNGADMRGTIYAVYSFSELVLGVKPLWFWTSEKPASKKSVQLQDNYFVRFGSPYVKYRAWLPNDTDLLSPWQRKSAENYEAFYESMLRLKLNTLEGVMTDWGSFSAPFRAGKAARTAAERGLFFTGHHVNILGSTYAFWDHFWKQVKKQPVPELKVANKAALTAWWEFHIDLALQNNIDVIWLTGFRGNRDIPFWEFFDDAPKDPASRARVIEEMVQIQIDLLKQKTKNANPAMRLTLYNEMSTMVANGSFHIPDEPSLIRNFVAARRDHFPAADIRTYLLSGEPVGYYMNFQFTSSGSHLAQGEGPRKMEQNFRMVDSLSKGNLVFSVVNAGNMREHLLELSANADMMWNFKSFNPDSFLLRFSQTYYGAAAAPVAAGLYRDYYNAFWQQKKPDIAGFVRQYIFQDMRYGRAAEMLIGDLEKGVYNDNPLDNHPLDNPDKGSVGYFRVVPSDLGVTNQLQAMEQGTRASASRLEQLTKEAERLAPKLPYGKLFFSDNLLGQSYFMLHLNRSLNFLVKAYQTTEKPIEQQKLLQQSLKEWEKASARLKMAEHDVFVGWYANDAKFGLKKIENRLRALIKPPVVR